MAIAVAVVDDDVIARHGIAAILERDGSVEVCGVLAHDDAMTWDDEWDRVHVAIVDAADERARDDQLPGVAVVERIRARRAPNETLVIVITGHAFATNVRWRMREAGADFLYHRSQIADAEDLRRAVLQPGLARRVAPEPIDEEMFALGIDRSTRVNRGVEFVLANQAVAAGERRSSHRWRTTFNSRARLQVRNSDGTLPERQQSAPSMRQIDRLVQWATRVERRSR
jgi:DNA-binding NarL/FixJ family response regulator